LCGWLYEELESIPFDWDRSPRLGSPRIGFWRDCHHAESGAVVLIFMLYGNWTNAALYTLRNALQVLIPGRVAQYMVGPGAMRVTVLLGTADAGGSDRIDLARAGAIADATFLALARACAALDDLPIPPLDGSVTIPASADTHYALDSAQAALGSKEAPAVSDDWAPSEAEWLKPRHSIINVTYDLVPRFNFMHASSPARLKAYISALSVRLTAATGALPPD
jgi:hypothetical protein